MRQHFQRCFPRRNQTLDQANASHSALSTLPAPPQNPVPSPCQPGQSEKAARGFILCNNAGKGQWGEAKPGATCPGGAGPCGEGAAGPGCDGRGEWGRARGGRRRQIQPSRFDPAVQRG